MAPEFDVQFPSAPVPWWATGLWNGGHCLKVLKVITGDDAKNISGYLPAGARA